MMNKIMMNIEVPCFWYLDFKQPFSSEEIEYQTRLHENVIYIKLKEN